MTVRPIDERALARLRPTCGRCHAAGRVVVNTGWMRWCCVACGVWSRRITRPERQRLFPQPDVAMVENR
jgi:hypothetical protein